MFWNEIHQFDQGVSLEINSWDSPVTDPIWQFFSSVPAWIPMYLMIAALLVWKLGWKNGLIVVLAAGLTFGLCDQLSNLVKDAVGRVRPLNDADMLANGLNVLEKSSLSFSFFSAHAANAFGLATCTFVAMKRILLPKGLGDGSCFGSKDRSTCGRMPLWFRAYAIWMFIWAPLVAISRVFVGKHYLGDVMVGALIGTLSGYVFARLASWACQKFTR
jgi:undecaprenyl-diphosphatase